MLILIIQSQDKGLTGDKFQYLYLAFQQYVDLPDSLLIYLSLHLLI